MSEMRCMICDRPLCTLEVKRLAQTPKKGMILGWHARLMPWLVNARWPHASGHAWYVRGSRVRSLGLGRVVRFPFVVTCDCGQEQLINPRVDSLQRIEFEAWIAANGLQGVLDS